MIKTGLKKNFSEQDYFKLHKNQDYYQVTTNFQTTFDKKKD